MGTQPRAVVFRYESDQIIELILSILIVTAHVLKGNNKSELIPLFLQAYSDENLRGQFFTTSKLALYHLSSSRFDGFFCGFYRHCSRLESVRFLGTPSTPSIRVLVA